MTKSSAIIKHIISLRDAKPDDEKASLAYFYFDFRDEDKKQDIRNFITSLLVQLSTHSIPCRKIISDIYSTHGKGAQQPSIGALKTCLRKMLAVDSQKPIYIIVDALDECPKLSGMPTPRAMVLSLLKDLVSLRFRNLHICVTSRPEVDIQNSIGPLAHSVVSLHEESGQMKDILDYIRNVVYSDDSDSMMRTWRSDQKELVFKELSKKADGMYAHHALFDDRDSYLLRYRFRWVFCQLEVLRHCFPASIRLILDHLPESLDETYLHVLRQIPQANKAHAHRMLQCILVAVRPLRVEELAEVLAFEFDASQEGIPKYRATWQLDDQTQAVLSTCSSLVTIVDDRSWDRNSYSSQLRQVVQFSHFSVKEFLMSNRLGDFSQYHIHPLPAHTLLTQACLGALLYLDDSGNTKSVQHLPLAKYAAQHWVEHAQFQGVPPLVKDGMETLFDSGQPHFAAWLGIYNLDKLYVQSPAGIYPLYYSARCGFYDLVEHLVLKHSQQVNAICGQYKLPLLAAVSEGHFVVAELLLKHGAYIDARDEAGKTPLHIAVSWRQRNPIDVVTFLLDHKANVNSRDGSGRTPLLILVEHQDEDDILHPAQLLLRLGAEVNTGDAGLKSPLLLALARNWFQLSRIFLEHGADVNAANNGKTLTSLLSKCWTYNHHNILNGVKLLLEHKTELNRRNKNKETPLHLALGRDLFKVARILLEHGADANAEDNNRKTPLHILAESQTHDADEALDLFWPLLEHGAIINGRDKNNQTPLHLALGRGWFKLAQILLEHGADANAKDDNRKTPLHLLSESQTRDEGEALDIFSPLLEHGAIVNGRDETNQTPLHLATGRGLFKLARILLEHGADANAKDNDRKTPLHLLSESQICDAGEGLDLFWPLLEHGAIVNGRDKKNQTPLHLATGRGWFKLARILLEHGADAGMEDDNRKTSLHLLAESQTHHAREALGLFSPLLEHGAIVNGRDKNKQTPLHLATGRGWLKLTQILLEHGADANAVDNSKKTPLHLLTESQTHDEEEALGLFSPSLEHGATVNVRDKNNQTLLHLATGRGWFKLARILLEHGADTNVEDDNRKTPLHLLLESRAHGESEALDLFSPLLEHGTTVNMRDKNNQAPLHLALRRGWFELARILLEHDADANVEDDNRKTPLHLLSESQTHDEGEALGLFSPLLEHGAIVNGRDKKNQTPLHLALGRDWFKLAQILLEHGADASMEDDNRKTPLHLLTESRTHDEGEGLDLFWSLLEHGAIMNGRDKKNQTPLHLALVRDWFKLARILLEHGADASMEDDNRKTPLHLLTESRTHDEVEAIDLFWPLLEHGAIVNGQDKKNQTPLHMALGRDWFKLARILLEHGADTNAENHNGRTPLHILSERQIYYNKWHRADDVLNHTKSWVSDAADVISRSKDEKTSLISEKGTEMYK